jgi:hypothetical protein
MLRQMKKEFEKRINFVGKRSGFPETTNHLHLEEEMKEEDVIRILHDVLNEHY